MKFNAPIMLYTGLQELYDKGREISMTISNMMDYKVGTVENYEGVQIRDGYIVARYGGVTYGEAWEETVDIDMEDFYLPYDELVTKYENRRKEADKEKQAKKEAEAEIERQKKEKQFEQLKAELGK